MTDFEEYDLDSMGDADEPLYDGIPNADPDNYIIDDIDDGAPSAALSDSTSYQLDDDEEPEDDPFADIYEVEDDPVWEDTSNSNYASSVRNGENIIAPPLANKSAASPLAVLFKTMFTPVEGWKALRRAAIPADDFASRCFYPLLAIAACSKIADRFYEANISFVDTFVEMLISFLSLFFGYFSAGIIASIALPGTLKGTMKTWVGKDFLMLAISTLAIFFTVFNLLPMIGPALVFLPIWTVYIIFRGVRILRVPADKEALTVVLLATLAIGMPILWNWVFTELFPLSSY
ncbi:MAG: hypothetical protein K2M37_04930 [Muribaculaceae bacterium]|nr:hypothetical protein [Muribaculaceae bacterium]